MRVPVATASHHVRVFEQRGNVRGMTPASATARERLRFDDLDSMLLLKNGNYLYKVPFRGGFAVLKVYQGSRTWWQYFSKSCGNVLVCNQTSFMPRAPA